MKTLKLIPLPVLEIFKFGWQIIRYTLIFVSAFFRQRASLDVRWYSAPLH
jgi:hypothetical protein